MDGLKVFPPISQQSSRTMILAVLISLWALPALAQATRVEIFPNITKAQGALRTEQLVNLVEQQFGLLSPSTPYGRAGVNVLYDDVGQPDYLVVHLLHKDSYLMETAKVVLGLYDSVQYVQRNYIENADDLSQTPAYVEKATCPDETVDIVYGTYTTEFPSATEGVNKAYEFATKNGFKAVKLIGADASLTNYKNYLSCKNLKALGNIGHGSTSGIMIGGGTLSSSYFSALTAGSLAPKVLYFNSCQVHNSPLEPAILNAGASRFIGGNVNLLVGPSESVFKCFWEEALRTKGEMEPIVTR